MYTDSVSRSPLSSTYDQEQVESVNESRISRIARTILHALVARICSEDDDFELDFEQLPILTIEDIVNKVERIKQAASELAVANQRALPPSKFPNIDDLNTLITAANEDVNLKRMLTEARHTLFPNNGFVNLEFRDPGIFLINMDLIKNEFCRLRGEAPRESRVLNTPKTTPAKTAAPVLIAASSATPEMIEPRPVHREPLQVSHLLAPKIPKSSTLSMHKWQYLTGAAALLSFAAAVVTMQILFLAPAFLFGIVFLDCYERYEEARSLLKKSELLQTHADKFIEIKNSISRDSLSQLRTYIKANQNSIPPGMQDQFSILNAVIDDVLAPNPDDYRDDDDDTPPSPLKKNITDEISALLTNLKDIFTVSIRQIQEDALDLIN